MIAHPLYGPVRAIVKKHGGGWFGPNVEHIDMTEKAFYAMLDDPEFVRLLTTREKMTRTTPGSLPEDRL